LSSVPAKASALALTQSSNWNINDLHDSPDGALNWPSGDTFWEWLAVKAGPAPISSESHTNPLTANFPAFHSIGNYDWDRGANSLVIPQTLYPKE
jgi:hypothetical protein